MCGRWQPSSATCLDEARNADLRGLTLETWGLGAGGWGLGSNGSNKKGAKPRARALRGSVTADSTALSSSSR